MTLPEPYYDDGVCQIYVGDCRELLPLLPKVDLLLTDPPYGIGEAAGKNKKRTGGLAMARDYGNATWDDAPPEDWMFGLMRSKSAHQIIWGGNYFPLPPSSCWLVWDKENGETDFADCELAWTNLRKAVRRKVYKWQGMLQEKMGRDKEQRYHPTQKPLDVMTWAISQAPDDCETILDPFMGSGTTLRAAKDLNRKAIGIEINPDYAKIAAERLRQEVLAL
jgi:DNA modification methylase